jgi:hypothetical protein
MHKLLFAGIIVASVCSSSVAFAEMTKDVRTKFVARCQTSMYMSNPQCSCMADIANKTLDDLDIAYLSLDPLDVTNSAAMSKKMTGKELNAVDHFMSTAPHTCKNPK